MKVVRVTAENVSQFRDGIVALESLASYPLGSDFFRIDHGKDYFSFFNRMGMLRYYVMLHNLRVVAVAAAVLRSLPLTTGVSANKAWYLCDLKVHPDFRGQTIPQKIFGAVCIPNYLRCRRGFALSMNPADGSPNRIVALMAHFRWLPFELVGQLSLFSLSFQQLQEHRKRIEIHFGPVSLLSLAGKKDLILQSTGKPMGLLHLQHGPCGQPGNSDPTPGFTHMFCVPDQHPLRQELAAANIHPDSTVSVLGHRMSKCDWTFVLTSDI